MDGFLLRYDSFEPESEGVREALTSTGNGCCVRREDEHPLHRHALAPQRTDRAEPHTAEGRAAESQPGVIARQFGPKQLL